MRTLPAHVEYRRDDVRRESVPSFSAERSHIDLPMYAAQIDHFLDCILEDRQAICDGQQGVRNMILLQAAYASARGGESVSLASTSELRGRTATA